MEAISVSQLNNYIKQTLYQEDALRNILVMGTITNLKKHSSGHYYFSLKDEKATIEVSLFHARKKSFAHLMENGLLVTLRGSINFYEPWGRISITCQDMFIADKSPLQIAFEKLKAELTALGYFEAAHKKRIPYMSGCIGMVTSSSGAVMHDILNVARQRNPLVTFKLFAVPVQGADAGPMIAKGLQQADADPDIDVIIVGRGGGSMEDLWCFNDRTVVEALYHCKKPTISAVGHETDYTLCDFAADQRCSTPSHAAELAVLPLQTMAEQLIIKKQYLDDKITRELQQQRQHIHNVFTNRLFYGLIQLLQKQRTVLRTKQERMEQAYEWRHLQAEKSIVHMTNILQQAFRTQYGRKDAALTLLMQKLELINPVTMMKKGYSKIEKNENPIHSIKEIAVDDKIQLILNDGEATAIIKEVRHGEYLEKL